MSDLPAIGLLEACDAPELFGLKLFPKQRELLAAVESGVREHVWAIGRGGSKLTLAAVILAHSALFRDDLDQRVQKGETRYCANVATRADQSAIVLNHARRIISESPALRNLIIGETEDEIRLQTVAGRRTAIKSFPCTSRGIRGWRISTLVLDEFAHFRDGDGNDAGDSVWKAITPSLVTFGEGAQIVVISAPAGTSGPFLDRFDKAVSGQNPNAQAAAAERAEVQVSAEKLSSFAVEQIDKAQAAEARAQAAEARVAAVEKEHLGFIPLFERALGM